MPIIETSELVWRYFFMSTPEEIQLKDLDFHQDCLNSKYVLKEFMFTFKDEIFKEIMS